MKIAIRLVFGAGCALLSAAVWSQMPPASHASYPAKPIRMIIAGPPGGTTDTAGRIMAPGLVALLGQPIVIDSRTGAAGAIACDLVAKSEADGYTVLLGFSGPLVIVPNLRERMPYDTLRDLAPVSLLMTAPYVMLVHPSVPARSVKDLITLAQAHPDNLNYGSGGVGTGIHMSAELFKLAAGVKIVHVSYKSAGPALTGLLSGEVDMGFVGLTQALPHIKSGRARAIATGGKKRHPMAPDLATLMESGYPVDASGWYGVLAPAKTPPAIVTRLYEAIAKVLLDAEVVQRLNANAFVLERSTPSEFRDFLRQELATWRKVVEAAGLKIKGNR
ncbi:MAG: tripartite tricarboxylate transporter substrate binding protein [Betaproteobacteria bacterium]|nr:tripartite tricarboxylate transporter substrate binding protein [Betaproteobacteria bacterium]